MIHKEVFEPLVVMFHCCFSNNVEIFDDKEHKDVTEHAETMMS